jgi:BirA family biotin operon repressor/biotin-[acetyl-CoA-carboxylase] ligase
VSCLSVCKALEKIYGQDRNFLLKWPNDILLHGRKCSGILLETETGRNAEVEAVILGIGINILSAPAEVGIALEDATGIGVPLASIRDTVLQILAHDYTLWRQEGFAPFRRQWLEKTVPAQTVMSVGHGNSLKSGMFQDIDPKGGLVLKTPDGRNLTVTSGEVLFM